jgi:hypothetical protein
MMKTNAEFAIRYSAPFATFALCLALAGAAAMLYYHQRLFVPRALESRAARQLDGGYAFGNDFYQIWLTSREWLTHRIDPYSEQATGAIQIGLYGRRLDSRLAGDPKDQRRFPYPAFVDLLFWPATQLPFATARVVVLCILIPLTMAGIWLWMKVLRWRPNWQWTLAVFVLVLTSYPVLEGFYAGQIGLVVAFLLPAAILSLQRGRLLLSGVLLALTLIKPQVTVLAVAYLLLWSLADLRQRGRFCVGFLATAIVLVASALLVWPRWIESWMHLLAAYRGYNPPPLWNMVLGSLGVPNSVSFILSAALMIVAVALAWQERRAVPDSLEFAVTLSLLLALTTVVVLAGQAVYDHIILLPGILVIAAQPDRLSSTWIHKGVLATGAIVLFWPWFASLLVIALHPFLSHHVFFSRPFFYLPIDLAAPFPFLVLASLALAIRGEKVAAVPGGIPVAS